MVGVLLVFPFLQMISMLVPCQFTKRDGEDQDTKDDEKQAQVCHGEKSLCLGLARMVDAPSTRIADNHDKDSSSGKHVGGQMLLGFFVRSRYGRDGAAGLEHRVGSLKACNSLRLFGQILATSHFFWGGEWGGCDGTHDEDSS